MKSVEMINSELKYKQALLRSQANVSNTFLFDVKAALTLHRKLAAVGHFKQQLSTLLEHAIVCLFVCTWFIVPFNAQKCFLRDKPSLYGLLLKQG